jgi:hypothetical protein
MTSATTVLFIGYLATLSLSRTASVVYWSVSGYRSRGLGLMLQASDPLKMLQK